MTPDTLKYKVSWMPREPKISCKKDLCLDRSVPSSNDYGIKHISKPRVTLMILSLMSQTIYGRYPRLQGHKLPPSTASSGCHHSSAITRCQNTSTNTPHSIPLHVLKTSYGPPALWYSPRWATNHTMTDVSEKTPDGLWYLSVLWIYHPNLPHTKRHLCDCELLYKGNLFGDKCGREHIKMQIGCNQ